MEARLASGLMLKPLGRLSALSSSRAAATGYVHPVTGKKPPTLEEFDPLNPGEWQIGVAGKILPRLPEGTRCGKLVMGKYGLYSPRVRRIQEEFSKNQEAGMPAEISLPISRKLTKIAWGGVVVSIVVTIHNFYMYITCAPGEVIWPHTLYKKKGGQSAE